MNTFGSGSSMLSLAHVPTYQEVRFGLEAELRRARRYERPLAVLVLTLDPPPATAREAEAGAAIARNGRSRRAPTAADHSLEGQLRFLLLGALLRDTLRESDLVSYAAESHRYVACLPESSYDAARRAVDRLGGVLRERTPGALRAGVAVYPSDGLTLENLLAHAQRDLAAGPLGRLSIMREASGS